LMIEQIPQLDGETGARACSAWVGYTLYFANLLIFQEYRAKTKLVIFLATG
jgi:hypothetical protein